MAKYSLRIKKSAAKELEAIPQKAERRRVLGRLRDLAQNPRPVGCQKLSGREQYRVRQGSYRILCTIEDDQLIVFVIRVAHRREVYR